MRPYRSPSQNDWQSLLLACSMQACFLQSCLSIPAVAANGDITKHAQSLEKAHDYIGALVAYEKVLTVDRDNLLALRGRSVCLAKLGDSSVRPRLPIVLKGQAYALMQEGQFRKALTDLDEFVTCCPNSWIAFSSRAICRAFNGNSLGSLQDVTRYSYIKRNVSFHIRYSAIRADVEDKSHPGRIAPPELMISTKECDRLREVVTSKLGANSAANSRSQAILSFFEHDYRKALSELSRVKAVGVEQASLLGIRSVCHRATGDFDESIKEARQAIALMPNERVYYDTLDGAYFAADRREDGLKELANLDREKPNNPAIMLTLADVNSQLGNRDQARVILTRLLAIDPRSVDAFIMRADIYKADLMNGKALADFTKAKELAPRDGKAIEGVGFCYYELNQFDKALENFDLATKLGYDLKRVYAAKALCLDKTGKAAMAARLREESAMLML